jgi:arabinogalactan endo-1,4-beta-galactosidase
MEVSYWYRRSGATALPYRASVLGVRVSMRCFVIALVAFGLSLVSALQYRGADFSSLLLLEATADIQYTASPTTAPQPFEQILHDYGVNLARIRIWTAGTYNLAYGLELATRARRVGMELLIDLHYDDTCNVPQVNWGLAMN